MTMNRNELQTLGLLGAYSTYRLIKGDRLLTVASDAVWMKQKANAHSKKALMDAKQKQSRSFISDAIALSGDVRVAKRRKRAWKAGIFIGKQLKLF